MVFLPHQSNNHVPYNHDILVGIAIVLFVMSSLVLVIAVKFYIDPTARKKS